MSLKSASSRGMIWIPCNKHFLGPTRVCHPNSISIGPAGFAQLTRVPNIETDTDSTMCDICSNRPHLCTACRRCGLKTKVSEEDAVSITKAGKPLGVRWGTYSIPNRLVAGGYGAGWYCTYTRYTRGLRGGSRGFRWV